MTTIAFDGNILAVDSAVSGLYKNSVKIPKLQFLANGNPIAISGNLDSIPDILDWLNDDRPAEPNTIKAMPSYNFTVVELDITTGICYEYNNPGMLSRINRVQCNVPYAAGSGGLIALGAMAAGASAIKAIKIAGKYDMHTNKKVKYYILDGGNNAKFGINKYITNLLRTQSS